MLRRVLYAVALTAGALALSLGYAAVDSAIAQPSSTSGDAAPGSEAPGPPTDPEQLLPVLPLPNIPKIIGKQLFVADYNVGNFSQWDTCQSVIQNGDCATYNGSHHSLGLVPGRLGGHAARFVVKDGDVPEFGGGERSEVSTSADGALTKSGDERWYQWSMRFPEEFANPTAWLIVMQWHSGEGSPPLAIEVSSDGQLVLSRDGKLEEGQTLGPVRRGQWVDYAMHVKFSKNSTVGFVEGWENGVNTIPKTRRSTMSSDENYLKQGIYRDTDETGTSEVWIDGLTITAPPPPAPPRKVRPPVDADLANGGDTLSEPEQSAPDDSDPDDDGPLDLGDLLRPVTELGETVGGLLE